MQIVDAQIHLWGTGLPSNLSHWQVTHFTPEEAIPLMDEGGVDAAVIHPPGWDPGSTEMAFKAVRDYPGRFAIMGSVPLDQPVLAGAHRRLAGAAGHARPALYVPARSGAAVARRRHDRLAVGRRPKRPKSQSRCWQRTRSRTLGISPNAIRGLRLTIDHLGGRGGLTTLKDAAAMTHMPQLLALAKYPKYGGEGDRRARLFSRGLSLSDHADVSTADLRRVWAAPDVLGHRHHQDAVLVAAMRDDVHRGTAVARRATTNAWSWARRCAPGGVGTADPEYCNNKGNVAK